MTVKTLTPWLLSIAMAMVVSASAMADIVECYREGPTVILKNHMVHMVFSPADGGRCVSLRMAPFGLDNELTVKPEAPTDDGGLMADTFWFPQAKNLQERVYSYTTFGDARSRSIHFVTRVGGDLEFLELHKTVSLSADSSRIRVVYAFHNRRESYADYFIGFQARHELRLAGRRPEVVVPMPGGAVRRKPGEDAAKEFVDPAGDWMAMVWDKTALLLKTDYAYLEAFASAPSAVITRKMMVKCGDTFSMNLSFEPVADFGAETIRRLGENALRVEKKGVSRKAEQDASGEYYLSMQVETPHVKWARPYSGGAIKALVLTNMLQQRDIVELAQRLGLEVHNTIKEPTASEREAVSGITAEWVENGLQTVSFSLMEYWFGDFTLRNKTEARTRLLRYLRTQPYDVLVIGGLEYQHEFDQDIRDEIARKVNAGMGLVYANPGDLDEAMKTILPLKGDVDVNKDSTPGVWAKAKEHFIVNGFDFRIFPISGFQPYTATDDHVIAGSTDGRPLITVSSHGKGRVVALGYDARMQYPDRAWYAAGLTPQLATSDSQYERPQFQPERELQYDYWEYHYALLSKCLVWAARKDNGFDLPSFTWSDNGKLELTVVNRGQSLPASCSFVFRNKYSDIIGRKTTDIQLATGRTPLSVSADVELMHGNNYCELIVADKQGRSLTWGAAFSKHDRPKFIDRLDLTRAAYAAGSPVIGQLYFNGPSTDSRFELTFEFHDLNGRLVDRLAVDRTYAYPGMSRQSFILSTRRCLDDGGVVTAKIAKDGVTWDVIRKRVVIFTPVDPDAFYLSGWASRFGGYYLKQLRMKRLREVGFSLANGTALESTYSIPESLAFWRKRGWKVQANYTLRPGNANPYQESYAKTRDKSVLVRKPCFSNPEFIAKCKADFTVAATQAMEYGGAVNYGAGDEISLDENLCFCRYCMKNFRDLLREEYGNLRQLNAEWGTNHVSFDAIIPSTLEEAHRDARYASWMLWRRSMEASLVHFYKTMDVAIKSVDPLGAVHFSGTLGDSIDYGVDYQAMSKFVDMKGYNAWWLVGELLRSFQSTHNQPYAYSWGHIWKHVIQGAYDGIGSMAMAPVELKPDLTLSHSGLGKMKFLDEMVRPGLVRLLKHSRRDNTRVALHYSRLSRFAAKAMDPEKGEHPTWEHNVESWSIALNTLGLQSDMLSVHELEAGKLSSETYDIFILPTSYALSSSEVRAIKEYVRAGGVIIADGRVGEFNEHLIPNDPRPLDGLFGVRPSAAPTPTETTLPPWGATVEIFDTGLKRGRAKQLFTADEPVAYVNSFGKGKAIYLNFKMRAYLKPNYRELKRLSGLNYFTDYLKLGNTEKATADQALTAQHTLLAAVLKQAGKEVKITARNADGTFLISNLARYRNEGASLLAFLACSNGGDAEIALDREYHVRDILADRSLGYTDKIPVRLKAGQDLPGSIYFVTHARLYSLMPVKLDDLVLEAPEAVRAGDDVQFTLTIPGKLTGTTTVYFTVYGPDDRRLRHYDQALFVRYGGTPKKGTIKLALNDEPGSWKIVARDMLSGVRTQRRFSLAP